MSDVTCAFCREPVNAGATVCKSCGRKQPASDQTRRKRRVAAAIAASSLCSLALIAYFIANEIKRENALADAEVAVAFCGPKDMTEAAIQNNLANLHNAGESWADAAKTFRVLIHCGGE